MDQKKQIYEEDGREQMLRALRNDARTSLAPIAEGIHVPQSTVYAMLRAMENTVIKRHAALIDYRTLGYTAHALLLVSVPKAYRDSVEEYLRRQPNVNSLWRTSGAHEFVAELVFKDHGGLKTFTEIFEEHNRKARFQVLYVLEQQRHEEFLR